MLVLQLPSIISISSFSEDLKYFTSLDIESKYYEFLSKLSMEINKTYTLIY